MKGNLKSRISVWARLVEQRNLCGDEGFEATGWKSEKCALCPGWGEDDSDAIGLTGQK